MAKTDTKPNRSDIWADEFAGTGKQHTIYAPDLFFTLWAKSDRALKAHVNAFLLDYYNKPKGKAAKKPAPIFEATDDDI